MYVCIHACVHIDMHTGPSVGHSNLFGSRSVHMAQTFVGHPSPLGSRSVGKICA